MRVATWNVNSVRARLAHVEKWLMDQKPDVLCLQETKVVDEDFPTEVFQLAGYQVARTGQPSYNGVAVLSRHPIESTVIGLVGADVTADRRLIRTTVRPAAAPPIQVWSVYVPNGKSLDSPAFQQKLEFMTLLCQTVREAAPEGPLIVAGDFNIAADARDVHDAKKMEGQLHFTEAERKSLTLLQEVALLDALRAHTDEAAQFSWWDYRMGSYQRNKGLRIDYIFARPELLRGLERVWIDREPRGAEKPSDHTPVVFDFAWP